MTTFTHTLLGMALGFGACTVLPETFDTSLSKFGWSLIFAGVSNLPDLDILLHVASRSVRATGSMWKHRGVGHSIFLTPFYAALPCFLLGFYGCGEQGFWMYAVFWLVVLSHYLCDAVDGSDGLCLLAPLSERKFSTGYCINSDIPLDALSSYSGRRCLAYGLAIETIFVTLPTSFAVGVLSLVAR